MSAPALPTLAAVERDLIRRRGLAEFVRRAWSQVESAPLVWNWHLDAMCEHLEAVTRRDLRHLVINVPPGNSKSLVASVLWPAWEWTLDPSRKWICASFSDQLSLRDAGKCRTLVNGDWFQARFPEVEIPTDRTASTAKSAYYTTAKGFRYSMTVRQPVTGHHAHTHLIDDPIDPEGAGAASGIELDEVLRWDSETMSTRFCDLATSARVLIMQRLHERDLAAAWVREGATVLCLPMRYESKHPHAWSRDPRTAEGELLNPKRFPEGELVRLEDKLGPRATAAQLQQRPAPAAGAIFREEWLQRHWIELPPGGQYAISVDAAFKGTDTSDYVVIQVWYTLGPNHFLVDQVRGRMDFVQTVAALTGVCQRYPKALLKLIEDKANGPAIVAVLKPKFSGLVEVTPDGGKVARAHSVEPLFAGGNVWFPDPVAARYDDGRRGAPWVPGVKLEMLAFPVGANDDQVDALTQYLRHVALGSYASRLKAAVDKANPPRP